MIPIYFKKLNNNAKIPVFGHNDNTNAAVDIYSCIDKNIIIWPKSSKVIDTGITWYVDTDYMETFLRYSEGEFSESDRLYKLAMVIQSRSGLAFKQSLEASNAGVIDEAYQGEIKVKLYNNSWFPKIVKNHERIAQGVIELLPMIDIKEWIGELPKTVRGDKGFGSSGTN